MLGGEWDFQGVKKFKYFVYNKRKNTFAFVTRILQYVLTEPDTPTDRQTELSTQHMRINWFYLSLSFSFVHDFLVSNQISSEKTIRSFVRSLFT